MPAIPTDCHCTHRLPHALSPLSFVVWYPAGTLYSSTYPKALLGSLLPDGLVFLGLFSLSPLNILLFFLRHFLILIQRKSSGLHNRIFFSFLFVLFRSLPPAHHSRLSPSCTLFHQNCASRQKGHRCSHR